jgi:transposase
LRDLRELLRHRAVLRRMRAAVKNRVHALLARQGILPEHTDLFGTGGREFLASLELPAGSRRRLDSPHVADLRLRPRDHRHDP